MKPTEKEESRMKFLKIEREQGFFSLDGENWLTIDKIGRDGLLSLLELSLGDDFEMDEFDKDEIRNPAHQIIYSNIYGKLLDLSQNKERFKDESESLYKSAIEKYGN